MKPKYNTSVILLTIPLVLGISYVSLTGLLTPDFYHRETLNWQVQSVGQDMFDLVIAMPILLISGLLVWQGSINARWVWGGTLLYLIYTFCLYSFDVHFNSLFLFYCINLGFAFYGLLYFIYTSIQQPIGAWSVKQGLRKTTAWYLILLAILFYLLWLTEVIPAMISGISPLSLQDVGLPTNGVHVIDLSVFLPGMFIVGLLLLRKNALGDLLAPVLLTFLILMDLTIAGLTLFMNWKGLPGNPIVAMVMLGLAIFSLMLLIMILKRSVQVQPPITPKSPSINR